MKKTFLAPTMRVIAIGTENILTGSGEKIGIQDDKYVSEGNMYAPERHSIWE